MNPSTRLAIVVAEFNQEITEKMLRQALRHSAAIRASVTYVCKVPGSYDVPLIIEALLKKDNVDAVVTLGAIVRGETKHDEVIAHAIAAKLIDLSLHYGKPVTLGIAGPGMTRQQAKARVIEYADRSVNAAVQMVLIHKKLNKKIEKVRYPLVVQ